MIEKSTAFERRVERIHRLLEGEDAVVTWNERIPDPDNPSQPRQIDVTIRRPDSFTIVECRLHATPQDVKWIEELIGRRASLRADAVIAVSNSGFTQGAESKAAQFGIILRDFNTLTQEEIRNWGKHRKVRLIFYEFTDNVIIFRLPEPPIPPIVIADHRGNRVSWRGLFEHTMRELDKDPWLDLPEASVDGETEFDTPIFINGTRVTNATALSKISAHLARGLDVMRCGVCRSFSGWSGDKSVCRVSRSRLFGNSRVCRYRDACRRFKPNRHSGELPVSQD